jgi:hypothetical protein
MASGDLPAGTRVVLDTCEANNSAGFVVTPVYS